MSLLRLLAAGRSLIGMRETVSPYRMRTANPLPKFGSTKNPFKSTPKTEPANLAPAPTPVAAAPASPKPTPAKAEPVKMETISLFDAKPVVPPAPVKPIEVSPVADQPVKAGPAQTKPASAPKVAQPRKRMAAAEWIKKVNPLRFLPVSALRLKAPVRSKGTRTPVQAELSLEKVKVVRNDLSETDLEIIPAKLAGLANVAGPVIQPLARTETNTWNRMTSKALAAGQTMIP